MASGEHLESGVTPKRSEAKIKIQTERTAYLREASLGTTMI
jgi:hypothetical protein